TVLSRKVRNSSVHRVARASPWPPRSATRRPLWGMMSACLAIAAALPDRVAGGRNGAAGDQLEQAAQAGVADLPGAVLVDGHALLSGQKGVAVYQDGTWKVGDASLCGLRL